jgi:hypothetical protein
MIRLINSIKEYFGYKIAFCFKKQIFPKNGCEFCGSMTEIIDKKCGSCNVPMYDEKYQKYLYRSYEKGVYALFIGGNEWDLFYYRNGDGIKTIHNNYKFTYKVETKEDLIKSINDIINKYDNSLPPL